MTEPDDRPTPHHAPPGSTADAPAPVSRGPVVFVSHSSRDVEVAMKIVAALESAGVPCWVAPRDIPAGADYNHSIMTGIGSCRALLLVYGRHSVDSGPVRREVERAIHHKRVVIPVRVETAAPSPALEFMISTSQWVDAFPPPLERHLDGVIAAVTSALDMTRAVGTADPSAAPKYIGPYRLLERLGEGGMGTVYKAEQRHPVKRTVAIKLVKPGMASAEVLARFDSERQALARMNHPNVARVLDAGADERGQPYFVMEYVPGVPITAFADTNKLSIRQRLTLFTQACDAIAHAHAKQLLHRDVKASNVLAYTAEDGRATVKVIDFGIAKALTADKLTDRTFNTGRGQVIGTYDSMSPEQAEGSADIDTRTDVYGLGVLLYELLSGAKPFDADTLRRAADNEVRRIIREVEPPRPSTRLSGMGEAGTKVAAARQQQTAALAKELRRELEWIPLMAMRKERDRRYATPLALAEDIRNYLEARPLTAAPDSVGYRVKKLVRRNKGTLTAGAAILIVLIAGITGTTVGLIGESRARKEADAQRAEAERQERIAKAQTVKVKEERDRAIRETYFVSIAAAGAHLGNYEFANARRVLEGAPQAERDWEWRHLYARLDESIVTIGGGPGNLAALSPDGKRVITVPTGDAARISDTAAGDESAVLQAHEGPIRDAAFSPDGSRVVTASSDKTARVWDATSGKLLVTLRGHGDAVVSVAFDATGQRVVTASHDKTARVWDAISGSVLATLRGHDHYLRSAAFSDDGKRIVTAAFDKTVRVWDSSTGAQLAVPLVHGGLAPSAAAFSPDGKRLVTADDDGATVWDAGTGKKLCAFHGHQGHVNSAAFDCGGSRVLTASHDGTARVWDAASGREEVAFRGHGDFVTTATFSPDGKRVVTASWDKSARVWDVASGREIVAFRAHDGHVGFAAFTPDGERVVTASDDGFVRIWTVDPGTRFVARVGHEANPSRAAFSRSGNLAAFASFDQTPRVIDVSSDKEREPLRGHEKMVTSVAFSPDGTRLVTASWDGTARVWEARSSKEILLLRGHAKVLEFAAFNPAGTRIVTTSQDKTARVWDGTSGKELLVLRGHEGSVNFAAYSRDGTRIVTTSYDLTARVWDAETGRELIVLRGHDSYLTYAGFSPSGTRIVTASGDKTARVWDAASGRELVALRGHEGEVTYAAFAVEGEVIVTTSADKDARIWDSVPRRARYQAERKPGTPSTRPTTTRVSVP